MPADTVSDPPRQARATRGPHLHRTLAASNVPGKGCTSPEPQADFTRRTVSDVMITAPKTLPIETSIACVQAAFDDPHVHMVLLACAGVLYGTLLRADLPTSLPPTAPALPLATLRGRTISPDERIATVHRRLVRSGHRRLAVVDTNNILFGLLCLKRGTRQASAPTRA
jgi:CBS domain-containing protein